VIPLAALFPLAIALPRIAFWGLAAVAVLAALGVVLHRNPVVEALFLVVVLLAVAGIYALMHAWFLAVLQVIVYAGAIVVLVTFVIMLLNLGPEARGGPGVLTVVLGALLALGLAGLVGRAAAGFGPRAAGAAWNPQFGRVAAMGKALFGAWFWPFEVVSLALLAALVGAVVVAKRRLEE